MEPVELRTDRLHLRPWRASDADAVHAACTDPEVQRWTTVPSPYTPEDAAAWTGRIAPQLWESGTGAPFGVFGPGGLLASVGLHDIADGTAQVGFWCAPGARGQGIVSEAVGVVCRWGFEELGLRRIAWYAGVGNWASRRVAERNGFSYEGLLREGLAQRGGRHDAWVGGRLATDPERDTRRLPPVPVLTSGAVTLRALEARDAVDIVAGYDDAVRAQWLPGPLPYGLDDAHAFLASVASETWDGTGVPRAITVDDDRLVGMVHLHLHHRVHGIGEIGYWVAPGQRGRGIAATAAALLAGWARDALGLTRVELLADVDNLPSQRAAEKAGFVRECVARRARVNNAGEARDMVLYSLV